MLWSGQRDVIQAIRQAKPMRIGEDQHGGTADRRSRHLVIADARGSLKATVRDAPAGSGPTPAVLILGGIGTGRRAVELVPRDLPFVVAALDYAWTGPAETSGLGLVVRLPAIQRDAMRTAVALRDLARHLARDPHVAGGRVYILGASLGSPIACAVAAAEPPAGLILLYGFADHATLLENRLRDYASSAMIRRWIAHAGAALIANFEADRTLPRLIGTPVLNIESPDDRDVPRRCREALWSAIPEPRTRIALAGGHIRADREAEVLRQATARAAAWLEGVERRSSPGSRATDP